MTAKDKANYVGIAITLAFSVFAALASEAPKKDWVVIIICTVIAFLGRVMSAYGEDLFDNY